jgi:hypothetical protein
MPSANLSEGCHARLKLRSSWPTGEGKWWWLSELKPHDTCNFKLMQVRRQHHVIVAYRLAKHRLYQPAVTLTL